MTPAALQRLANAKFRFTYGSNALNLAVTLRRRASEPVELLVTPEDASRWLNAAGLFEEPVRIRESELLELRELRDAIYCIGHAASEQRPPSASDLRLLNQAARRSEALPQLGDDWSVRTLRAGAFNTAIATLARDAIAIFGSDSERSLLRTCEQSDCGGLFLDRSRGERRRWCSMARCGNRAKVAAFRKRQKEERS
ncbi:MAG TPA: ABATE domain-containing protein [Candidatus Baltobacteraceae bacterium]|jgi:predicted RNA-binding Zn ribbon-like protein